MCSYYVDGCNLQKVTGFNKCILHCSKEGMSENNNLYDVFLNRFCQQLLEYIVHDAFKKSEETEFINKKTIRAILKNEVQAIREQANFLREHIVVFDHIAFPKSENGGYFDYIPVLQKLGKIHFQNCMFYISSINLLFSECFFQDCEFFDHWHLSDYTMLQNINEVIYQNCSFKKDVSLASRNETFKHLEISQNQFRDCTFQDLEFENIIFTKKLFFNSKGFQGKLNNLSFSNCTHKEIFLLQYTSIEHLNIHETTFNDKLEFEKVSIQDFNVQNSFFKGLVNCYNCNFYDFFIYKTTFHEFTGFEYSHFGLLINGHNKGMCAKFQYVTFLSFVNFRNTAFLSGLLLSEANFKEYPNFLDSKIDSTNTDVETFRIIKYSFDKIGNTTEANRYFSYEMNKERQETLFLKHPEKKIILTVNYLISNFGQSYSLPFFWIIIIGLLHYIILGQQNISANTIVNSNQYIEGLNILSKNIIPLQRFLQEGNEFISLMFFIIYSILIYNFIIAVKRRTKR
jgi:uncharacterized protein YjbI with pentapeptide repeats